MDNTVTVSDAIKKGHRIVTYPGLAILLSIIGLCLYLGTNDIVSRWMIPVGIVLGFLSVWLYWSFMITKWRIWAFDNVRNVHELRKRAEKENLIWGDKTVFEKTEIRSAREQDYINALQNKFKRADIFEDDFSIPAETIIYYSLFKNTYNLGVGLACLAGAIYLLITSDDYVIPITMILVCVMICFWEFKQFINRKPQIILTNKGIQTISTPFYKWSEISNEEVTQVFAKRVEFYLTYDHPSGKEELQINDYATNRNKLENLMYIYRGRSEKTTAWTKKH